MATLTIELDDEIYERLCRQAQANHRSVEDEARGILTEAVGFIPDHGRAVKGS